MTERDEYEHEHAWSTPGYFSKSDFATWTVSVICWTCGKRMQAKDLGDRDFLSYIDTRSAALAAWVCLWDFDGPYLDIPHKLIRAKAAKLIKRGFMTGCSCGCRGDFEITMAGRDYVRAGT